MTPFLDSLAPQCQATEVRARLDAYMKKHDVYSKLRAVLSSGGGAASAVSVMRPRLVALTPFFGTATVPPCYSQ